MTDEENGEKIRYEEKIAVAAIDILGISTILESPNGSQKAMEILSNIWANASVKDMYSKPNFNAKRIKMFEEDKKFGDSIYFFGDHNDNIKLQTDKLIANVGWLIVIGLYQFKCFLRCGIAQGDLLINTVEIQNAPEHLRDYSEEIWIGNSMRRARSLEENQVWMGGAVLGNAEFTENQENLIKYNIPLKKKNRIKEPCTPKYAINWLKIAKENEGGFGIEINKTNHIIDSIATSIGNIDNPSVREKIQNTKDFVNEVLGEVD